MQEGIPSSNPSHTPFHVFHSFWSRLRFTAFLSTVTIKIEVKHDQVNIKKNNTNLGLYLNYIIPFVKLKSQFLKLKTTYNYV